MSRKKKAPSPEPEQNGTTAIAIIETLDHKHAWEDFIKKNKLKKQSKAILHNFTVEERIEKAVQLANANQELARVDDQTKEIAAEMKAKLKSAQSSVNLLSTKVANGHETRTLDVYLFRDY